ncbi:hypothetical protein H0G86_011236 [Trichoderma simmonsii]|uniref:Uncharacterized protein n=1 Tax=Trichoderma simmonsii TaxID=1491479 RepID=A0A8G0LNY1_9HYPO|nr:hypothetical protein H0G86_011236 [Trichoderma simmonsii]
MLLDARAGASSPFNPWPTGAVPARGGIEWVRAYRHRAASCANMAASMIRWSAKATAHFFVAFQADGDKGEAEARIWTKLHSSPTITLPCLLAQTISNKSSSNKHAPIDFNNKH